MPRALSIAMLCGCLGCAASSSAPYDERNDKGAGKFGNATGNGPNLDNPEPGAAAPVSSCAPHCTDFPSAPIFDADGPQPVPDNAPDLFGDADDFGDSGACVLEPALGDDDHPGALFPRNWLRPRFRFEPLGGENLWEIRLTSGVEDGALVAYTTRTTWELPRDIWMNLTQHAFDQPIIVTIRGVDSASPKTPSGTRGTFSIAPVPARGKMVYWATTSSEVKPDTSKLAGFDVGDESVIDALTVTDVGDRAVLAENGRNLRGMYDDPRGVPAGHVQCIGCHVSTPDGEAVAFTDHWPWNGVLASVQEGSAGSAPSYLTKGAEMLLNQPWLGMQTFSAAHWSAGDRIMVSDFSPRGQSGVGFSDGSPYPSHNDGLAWFDLETSATFSADMTKGDVQQQLNEQISAQLGKAFGLIELQGETRSAGSPSFSHDGTRIAYTSADATQDGTLSMAREADVHVVPWNDRKGGTVEPLAGASEPGIAEYYPSFSADDKLIAFTREEHPDGNRIYYRPGGEIFVVPSTGGDAIRLPANDPPACGGQTSPGVINSWPKWSPSVMTLEAANTEFGARRFYWLIFSSARAYPGQFDLPANQYSPPDRRSSQLYITAIVTVGDGQIETYPAVYLWNQDPATSNLTPAWDEFKIPPVPGPD